MIVVELVKSTGSSRYVPVTTWMTISWSRGQRMQQRDPPVSDGHRLSLSEPAVGADDVSVKAA